MAPTLWIFAAALGSVTGFLIISRFVPDRWLVADADAASALYATIGMVYAILVALGALAVWEPRAEAVRSTEREATGLIEAYWSARMLEQPQREAVRGLIVRYTEEVIHAEWRSLSRERVPSRRAEYLLAQLRAEVEAIEPVSGHAELAKDQLLKRMTETTAARRARLGAASDGMPYPMWPVLIIGGIVSTVFLYLFGLDRTFPNGLMMFTVGGMIALAFVVIYELEYPFSRGLSIGPQAFQDALAQLNVMP